MFKSFEPKTGSGGSNWRRACDRLHHQFQSPVEKSHLPLRTRLCQFGPSVWIFSILDDSDIHQMPMRTSSCPSQEVFHLLRPKERLWRLWPMEVQNAFSFFQRSWIFFFDLQFDMFRKFWRIWAAGKKVALFHISVQDVGGVPKWKKLKLKNLSRRDCRNTQIIRTFFHKLVFEIRQFCSELSRV